MRWGTRSRHCAATLRGKRGSIPPSFIPLFEHLGHKGLSRDELRERAEEAIRETIAQGNLPAALKSFRDGLAIRDRLAQADPGNAGWQRDLSVSYAKLADVSKRNGEAATALDMLQQGRAIMVRLTTLSPDNAVWRRDLAWFDGQIAELTR
jgi:hypothetical protein